MLDSIDFTGLFDTVVGGVINLVVALVILLVFYIVARIVSGVIRKLLSSTNLDNRFAETVGGDSAWPLENIIARVVFWIIMLFGIIAFLTRIDLPQVAGPIDNLLQTVIGALPNIAAALVLLVVAFVIATVVKTLVTKGAETLQLDDRLSQFDEPGTTRQASIGATIGTALFWLVFLFFLPGILDKLGMSSVVEPLNGMLDSFLAAIPNILMAGIVLVVGIFVARIVRQIVSSLLAAVGVDGFGERAGLNMSISSIVGTLCYTVILLMVIVQALNALGIDSISGPATTMIDGIFSAVPNIFAAALILGISWIIGKLIAGLVSGLLGGVGFDGIPSKLGLNLSTDRTASSMVGTLILAGVMLLAAVAAADKLGFQQLTDIVSMFIGFAGNIVVGIIVLAIGLWLANLAYDFARNAGVSGFAASIVRGAVLVLVGSMALQAIGIGSDIVELAFGIGLGAIGIAAALAFGLGSREIAGREVERFIGTARADED